MASELYTGSASDSDTGLGASNEVSGDPAAHSSRKGAAGRAKKHEPALSRNAACITCRQRKVRCDARKPACSACRKTANVQNKNPDEIFCEYDNDEANSRKRKASAGEERVGKKGSIRKVADLQKTIGELSRAAFLPWSPQPSDTTLSLRTHTAELESKLHSGNGTESPTSQPSVPNTGGLDWNSNGSFGVGPLSSLFLPPNGNGIGTSFPYSANSPTTIPIPSTPTGRRAVPASSMFPSMTGGTMFDPTEPSYMNELRTAGLPPPQEFKMPERAFGQAPLGMTPGPSAVMASPGQTANNDPSAFQSPSLPASGPTSRRGSQVSPALNLPDPILTNSAAATLEGGSESMKKRTPLDDGEFFGLLWPNWPASLPSPKLIYSLCDVFFSKRFLGEDLVNKDKFFANLALPPTHRDFPHTALIHAMCAVATKFVTPDGEPAAQLYTHIANMSHFGYSFWNGHGDVLENGGESHGLSRYCEFVYPLD